MVLISAARLRAGMDWERAIARWPAAIAGPGPWSRICC